MSTPYIIQPVQPANLAGQIQKMSQDRYNMQLRQQMIAQQQEDELASFTMQMFNANGVPVDSPYSQPLNQMIEGAKQKAVELIRKNRGQVSKADLMYALAPEVSGIATFKQNAGAAWSAINQKVKEFGDKVKGIDNNAFQALLVKRVFMNPDGSFKKGEEITPEAVQGNLFNLIAERSDAIAYSTEGLNDWLKSFQDVTISGGKSYTGKDKSSYRDLSEVKFNPGLYSVPADKVKDGQIILGEDGMKEFWRGVSEEQIMGDPRLLVPGMLLAKQRLVKEKKELTPDNIRQAMTEEVNNYFKNAAPPNIKERESKKEAPIIIQNRTTVNTQPEGEYRGDLITAINKKEPWAMKIVKPIIGPGGKKEFMFQGAVDGDMYSKFKYKDPADGKETDIPYDRIGVAEDGSYIRAILKRPAPNGNKVEWYNQGTPEYNQFLTRISAQEPYRKVSVIHSGSKKKKAFLNIQ